MIRLVKLSMWDFKGLTGGPHTVDLRDISLLCGPNGYGKSTIFEAIELCLTGQISRLDRNIDAKTEDARSISHAKSPLHNNHNPFKLELVYIQDNVEHILRLKKSMNGNEKLSEYCNDIKLYIQVADGAFERRERNSNDLGLAELAKTYKLSTYISQDDASYFLRKRQQERHKDLSALTDTAEQHQRIAKLDKYHKVLSSHYRILDQKVNALSLATGDDRQTIAYSTIFEGRADLPLFDRELPYQHTPYPQLETTHSVNMENVQELGSFASSFKLSDYSNYKKRRYLLEPLEDDDALESLTLLIAKESQPDLLTRPQQMHTIQKELLLNEKLKYYFVKDILNDSTFLEYQEAFHHWNNYADILYDSDKSGDATRSTEDIVGAYTKNISLPDDDLRKQANHLWSQYLQLRQAATNYTQIIAKLISAREELLEHQNKLNKHADAESTACTYCGYDWRTNEEMTEAYSRQTQLLQELAMKDGETLSKLISSMNEKVVNPLHARYQSLKAKHDTYAYTYSSRTSVLDISPLLESLTQVLPDFTIQHPPVSEALEATSFEQKLSEMKDALQKSIDNAEVEFYAGIQRIYNNGRDMSSYRLAIQKAGLKPRSLSGITPSKQAFKEATDALAQEIKDFAANFNYDPAIVSKSNLSTLNKYFMDTPETELEKVLSNIKQKIPNTLAYLGEQFTIAQNRNYTKIKNQRDRLKAYKDDLGELIDKCRTELRLYENSLTKSLQIPFYIISARVLQNSPHGEGGLVIKPQGGETGKSLIIDIPGETQDAINQLSSGQLMVVSLAFFLALNIQTRRNGAKLLLIDDPIQDMDALNSHALIDVLRREFTGKDDGYQLIASTSSDMLMNLMKYKMHLTSDSIINVQDIFFSKHKDSMI